MIKATLLFNRVAITTSDLVDTIHIQNAFSPEKEPETHVGQKSWPVILGMFSFILSKSSRDPRHRMGQKIVKDKDKGKWREEESWRVRKTRILGSRHMRPTGVTLTLLFCHQNEINVSHRIISTFIPQQDVNCKIYFSKLLLYTFFLLFKVLIKPSRYLSLIYFI